MNEPYGVFTMDGRMTVCDEPASAEFILHWHNAARDLDRGWPHAYFTAEDENGKEERHVAHFNPLTITAVSTKVPPTTKEER